MNPRCLHREFAKTYLLFVIVVDTSSAVIRTFVPWVRIFKVFPNYAPLEIGGLGNDGGVHWYVAVELYVWMHIRMVALKALWFSICDSNVRIPLFSHSWSLTTLAIPQHSHRPRAQFVLIMITHVWSIILIENDSTSSYLLEWFDYTKHSASCLINQILRSRLFVNSHTIKSLHQL